MSHRLRLIAAAVGAIACLVALPASSMGESLSNDAYSNQGAQVLGASGSQGDDSGPSSSGIVTGSSSGSGVLPFTGLQLALIGLAAVALVGSGLALRRVGRVSGS